MAGGHGSCVSRVPIFGSLSGEQQAVVAGYARATRLGREQQLYGSGDRVGRLFVVHTGRVKVLRVASNGAEALVGTAGPGDVVGELAFVTGERPDHRVVAMGEVSLCVFDHRDLAAILAAYPGVVMRMLQAATRRLEAAEARLASMSSVDVTGRLAEYLLSLPIAVDSLGARDGRTRVRLPMAKKDLASFLGTTPESVSRALRRMTDDAVITAGRGPVLVINDPDALERLAQPA